MAGLADALLVRTRVPELVGQVIPDVIHLLAWSAASRLEAGPAQWLFSKDLCAIALARSATLPAPRVSAWLLPGLARGPLHESEACWL